MYVSEPIQHKTIVKIREGFEPPLILLHARLQLDLVVIGGYGTVKAFWPLKHVFSTTLWAIQVTPDTPLQSLEAQVAFYYRRIKEEQANGPYRICSFSASSLMAVAITKLLEKGGDRVEQLSFIDHFPTTFIASQLGVDISRIPLTDPRARQEFFKASVNNLVGMTHGDRRGQDSKRHQMANDLYAAYNGLPTSEFMTRSKGIMDGFLNRIFDFILSIHQESLRNGHGDQNRMEFMQNWLREVKAPVSVYLGTYGMLSMYSPDQYPPAEWYVYQCFKDVKITVLDAGHYDILESEGLIKGLQEKYLQPRVARL
ncbi:Highly reducing polyketide synthase stpks1 [Psilocybe cubensis]|nr:Highly reducing polyketide synthase stpks1 [Psilocybe cubensis]KAH9474618.1 Highly reducing polyketide synthase stpks1 [Psilocybe cubensis]